MNSDDPGYPRYLERNRLVSDRKEALRLVNSIFDHRERYFEARNDIDQETALKFVELGQGIARTAVGFDIPRIAFRHDRPESRDALKMFLRTFRSIMVMNLDQGDSTTTITTHSIDRWIQDLDWLDKGDVSPVFQRKILTYGKVNREKYEIHILMSLWLTYLKPVHGRGHGAECDYQVATHFGENVSTVKNLATLAKRKGHGAIIDDLRKAAENLDWPHELTGENPEFQAAWRLEYEPMLQSAADQRGDEWSPLDASFYEMAREAKRKMLKEHVKNYLTKSSYNPQI